MRARYEPVVLTAAVTGGDVLPSQSPHIPRGVDAIVDEAVAAAEAGATSVHVHARDDDGRPTGSADAFRAIVAGIRARSDVLVNMTTGGAPGMTLDERLGALEAAQPDLATLNLGTMNYEGYPTPSRWPKVDTQWERALLEQSGDGVFVNTLNTLRTVAQRLRDLAIAPELEAYDLGHLHMARFLIDEGSLEPPVRVQLVLGVLGGASSALQDLFVLQEAARRVLGGDLAAVGVAGLGYPMQLRHAAVALSLGMDCRVGLEDNLRIRRDRQATSNRELVEAAVAMAEIVGRPIATPQQMRSSPGVAR